MTELTAKQVRDGYVPLDELDKGVKRFLRGYGKSLETHTDKIAYYSQMTAYNAYVKYYADVLKWKATIRQTKKSGFHYKLQPTGDPKKFSFFEFAQDRKTIWLLNNMPVESAHDDWRFFAPDVVVARPNRIQSYKVAAAREAGYERTVFSIRNADLV